MNQIETQLSQAIDAVYAALAVAVDEQVKVHLGDALDSLVSALHGDYEEDEA
jgi:hypothetical protein